MASNLSPELKSLVSWSVSHLGKVIERELGKKSYQRVETLRQSMANLRDLTPEKSHAVLAKAYQDLEKVSSPDRRGIALSYTLMLELMNTCESAYRTFRLKQTPFRHTSKEKPDSIIYVLTAHPTEARSPKNISVFHEIHKVLVRALEEKAQSPREGYDLRSDLELFHFLEIAWRTPLVRSRAPKVKDEAEHIYHSLLREDVIETILDINQRLVPVFIRTWVGGDKDGHPGVDEKTLVQSLNISRKKIVSLSQKYLKEAKSTLELISDTKTAKEISHLERQLSKLRVLKAGDGIRVQAFRDRLKKLNHHYSQNFAVLHPSLMKLKRLTSIFPGLVVPLELRESSDVLMSIGESKSKLSIEKMVETIARFSKGSEPRWYARGFVISMAEKIEHVLAVAKLQKRFFKEVRIPVVPLFENSAALRDSEKIVREMTENKEITTAAKKHWGGNLEIMVGYSDSAKEAGVLASRIGIAQALPNLEKICEKAGLTPLFFHGSGGSIDRGGGSIQEQTAWWPKSALRNYKVTIQGEMVERSFASSEITRGQVERILENFSSSTQKRDNLLNPNLQNLVSLTSAAYKEKINSSDFLEVVEKATPYLYLKLLKIGSRPAKRTTELKVSSLRAIPWVLCWTQTRILFPTWWGIGTAWSRISPAEKSELKKVFVQHPVFNSYVKALGFTLSKIEFPIWQLYLEKSALTPDKVQSFTQTFLEEFKKTQAFFHEVTGEKDFMWFRPWLEESVWLRSPMIHPLNLLQILAIKDQDHVLLRTTVMGIASGMMTTG